VQSLYDPMTHAEMTARIQRLQAAAARQWGKMDAAQMCAHCSIALEMATGDQPSKQALIGKLLTPFFREAIAGPKPFSKNSPTGPALRVLEPRDFGAERARLQRALDRFVSGGPALAERHEHGFLGRLPGDRWGRLMWKHLDHHLSQFSV